MEICQQIFSLFTIEISKFLQCPNTK